MITQRELGLRMDLPLPSCPRQNADNPHWLELAREVSGHSLCHTVLESLLSLDAMTLIRSCSSGNATRGCEETKGDVGQGIYPGIYCPEFCVAVVRCPNTTPALGRVRHDRCTQTHI